MKKLIIFIAILLAFTLFSKNLLAQRKIEKTPSFYDCLNSSNLIKKQADFNLKGNVKQVIEFSSLKQDSTILQFNNKGILKQKIDSETKEFTTYTFKLDRLEAINFEDHYSRSEKHFNGFGLLVKEVSDNKNTIDTFQREALYTYNTDLNELKIAYSYNCDTSRYDLVLFDYYKFIFKSNMQIREEQKHSTRTGPPGILDGYLGTTVKYDYYLISGLLKNVTYEDGCFPSNSCGNGVVYFNYDNQGNIVSKVYSDETIRNSFPKGDSWSAKYNKNNDIVEEQYADYSDRQRHIAQSIKPLTKGKVKKSKKVSEMNTHLKLFDYEYDINGNWVKRYETINNNRKLIKSRVIEYFN